MNSVKIILTQLFLFTFISMMGQQDTILVGFGETFETIANRYGVSMEELYAANPGKYKCYTGMKVIVPQPLNSPIGNKEISSVVILHADSLLLLAKVKCNIGEYEQAIKQYDKVIDMNVRLPYAYAGRGECYFNLKDYKKAKNDLKRAINSGKLAQIEKEWCESALEDVENEIRRKHERRKEIWGNIGLTFASAAAFTATAYIASEQNKMQNQYYQSSMPSSTSSLYSNRTNQILAQSDANIKRIMADGNAQLNMMTQQMMMRVQQTRQRMDQAFKEQMEWAGNFNKEKGRYPTEYEIDQWYSIHYPDLLQNRIMARGNMASNASDLEDDNKNGGSSSTTSSNSSSSSYQKDCQFCYGLGDCRTCSGKGYYYNPLNLSQRLLCPNCKNHNGRCVHCNGTGKKM